MRRKRKARLLLVFKIVAIVAAAVFMVKGVSSFYSEAKQDIGKEEETGEVQVITGSGTLKPSQTQPEVAVTNTEERQPTECEEEEDQESIILGTDWSGEEDYLLAKIAMAEAESEGVQGKALVMLVVLNRVWSDKFPDTIEEVIYQRSAKGVWQFSTLREGGRWYTTEPDRECYEALELIKAEHWDESQGALYFESQGKSDWHRTHLQYLFQYGNHYFYTEKELAR